MGGLFKDLTESGVQRQNVLNNKFAVEQLKGFLKLNTVEYKGDLVFTKSQLSNVFDVDERTIDRCISRNNEELLANGYKIIKGRELKEFKEFLHVDDTNVVDIDAKIPQLGIFSFKALLNIAMLLTESERAKHIRSRILEVVIDVVTKKAKDKAYINQRDADYLPAAFQEENYRKQFTDAIDKYIDSDQKWKYGMFTNLIYKAIFNEDAKEYRKVLNLQSNHSIKDTFYSEILELISSLEAGFAEELKETFEEQGRLLSIQEAKDLLLKVSGKALYKPYISSARTKMASRDFSLRDAIHYKLEQYIQAMPASDYERFLGDKSKDLEERIKESIDVYKRLKDR